MEAMPGFEPGIKALQASALPLGYIAVPVRRERRLSKTKAGSVGPEPIGPGHRRVIYGADDRIRTGDPNLGKVVLYQLSHVRIRRSARGRIANAPAGRKDASRPNGRPRVRGGAPRTVSVQYPSLRSTQPRAISSGGEHFLDTEGVVGSNPTSPTTQETTRYLRKLG